jgi:hypothetical protein
MNKDEALKLALEALEAFYYGTDIGPRVQYAAITAIQEALAQPNQEPVAKYIGESSEGSLVQLYDDVKKAQSSTPPHQSASGWGYRLLILKS